MKMIKLFNNLWFTIIIALFLWATFVVALAWSVMRYNYAIIPHDITIADGLESIIVMGIVVSAVPFILATLFTYKCLENFSRTKSPTDKKRQNKS